MASSISVVINGTTITLPNVNTDPNWAEGVVTFFQQVAIALQGVTGTWDIPPQSYTFISNINTAVPITQLSFPTSEVRSVEIIYSIIRTTNTNSEAETGKLYLVYNASATVGSKWEMSREFTGSSGVTFTVDDTGQISFSSTLLAGSGFSGNIVFQAKTLQQSY